MLQEKKGELLAKCIATEPKHGETWQSVAKDPANANKSTEEILNLVVEAVG